MKRVHIFYSGRVQGVGFRFVSERSAVEFGVVGWVKNLGDGRVELICEGEEEKLNKLISKIEKYFSDYIRNADVSWQEAIGEFKDFSVKF